MSLANMSAAANAQRDETQTARRQLAELQELISQWFNESNCGAREFLVEVARIHRGIENRRDFAIQQTAQQTTESA